MKQITKPYHAMITADLHYTSAFQNEKHAADMDEVTAEIISRCSRENADALLICGDLTNGNSKDMRHLACQLHHLAESCTLVIVPGNHDFQRCSKEEFESIFFPLLRIDLKDESSLSYACIDGNIMYLAMDDSSSRKTGGYLSEETVRWLEECLQYADCHHLTPVFLSHHSLFADPWMKDPSLYVIEADGVISLLQRYNVRLAFSGHQHVSLMRNRYGITECIVPIPSSGTHRIGSLEISDTEAFYTTASLNLLSAKWTEHDRYTFEQRRKNLKALMDEPLAEAVCRWYSALDHTGIHEIDAAYQSEEMKQALQAAAGSLLEKWIRFVSEEKQCPEEIRTLL